MSKSRTGRKGRVRLAVAAAMGNLDAAAVSGGDANNLADIINANGQLGTDSGFRSDDVDKTNAQILDYIQGELQAGGTDNAVFQNGAVIGPLADAVDTQNGATGAITSADSGPFAAVNGETGAIGAVPLSTSGGTFAHFVLPEASEGNSTANAIVAAAGGAAVNATAQVSQLASTDVYGICYHPGGPGSDFVPVRDLGTAAANSHAATCIVINPSMADIHADTGVPAPANMQIEVIGRACSATASSTAIGDTIRVQSTNRTPATCVMEFNGRGVNNDGRGGATSNGLAAGDELVFRDSDGSVMFTIIGSTNTATYDAGADTGWNLTAADTDGQVGGATPSEANLETLNGVNYFVYPAASANANTIYIISHASANGATAYAAGTDDDQGMGAFARTIKNAIELWSLRNGRKIVPTQGTGGLNLPAGRAQVTLTMNHLRGTDGDNAGGAEDSPEGALTMTAYGAQGRIVVPNGNAAANPNEDWFVTPGSGTAILYRTATGGNDGTNFDTAADINIVDQDNSTTVDLHDFPVRVSYVASDNVYESVASGALHGVGSALIDCNLLVPAVQRVNLRFTVPIARGGEALNGGAPGITGVCIDEGDATGVIGEGTATHTIGVGSQGANAAAMATRLTAAINGVTDGTVTFTSNAAENGATNDANGGLNLGVVGVEAEDIGNGLVRVYLGPSAEGFADDGTSDCFVARASGDAGGSLACVEHDFAPAGQPVYSSAGFAIIWGPV